MTDQKLCSQLREVEEELNKTIRVSLNVCNHCCLDTCHSQKLRLCSFLEHSSSRRQNSQFTNGNRGFSCSCLFATKSEVELSIVVCSTTSRWRCTHESSSVACSSQSCSRLRRTGCESPLLSAFTKSRCFCSCVCCFVGSRRERSAKVADASVRAAESCASNHGLGIKSRKS